MWKFSEANKYTFYGAIFGCFFPVGSVFFLYFIGALAGVNGLLEIVRWAHTNPLLYVIDSAPLFLGLMARIAGMRQDRIQRFSESLEQQVRQKTESLRVALEDAHKSNEMIAYMADHDALTGLLNRRRFQKTLESWIEYAIRYERKGTLIFIDLDKFKFVNDTYGHSAGDQYLTSVATLLTSTLRSTDIVSRWGGDEFAAFLPETIGQEAHHVANKLLATFAKSSVDFAKQSFQPSASIGLAFVPEHARNANELTVLADAAMYEAKKSGRGCWRLYVASETEIHHVQEHLQWEARIRRALENDQFLLVYQPVLNLATGRTDGYEALLRMEDRDGQLIAPGRFLESAERCNLSSLIDFMVIRKAARRITPLTQHQPALWMSVNLSYKTLQDKNLVSQVEMILQEHAGQKGRLRFEVSETTVLENLSLMRDVAIKIQQLGGVVILDDFGLGPSPLHYLEQLSIAMVKIHPSLIRGLSTESKNRSHVKNLTEMAHQFHLEVAAKSVEAPQLFDTLREIGVDYAQGFAIGKPLESLEHSSGDNLATRPLPNAPTK
ncbi:MAG: EAL domain-containing protein [Gammaproteobacteria bacterium]|nr:EAL domain-containing protein [Gammaproteobacteria bacterium]